MKYIKLFENFNNTLINESYSLQDFINSSKDPDTEKIWTPFWTAIRDKDIDINSEWNNIIKMDAISLKNLLGVSTLLSTQLEKFFKSNQVASEDPITERLKNLKKFFKSGGTGEQSQKIIAIYKHFKNGGEMELKFDRFGEVINEKGIDKDLYNLYKRSRNFAGLPGILNFTEPVEFTKEEFMKIVEELAKDDSSFGDYIEDDVDKKPYFSITSDGRHPSSKVGGVWD